MKTRLYFQFYLGVTVDNSSFIQTVQNHIAIDHKFFPSNTHFLLNIVQEAISQATASPEENEILVKLEEELSKLKNHFEPSFFLGSSFFRPW